MRASRVARRSLATLLLVLAASAHTPGSLTPAGAAGATSVVAMAAGPVHTCAVTSGGAARCWGSNWYGQLGTDDTYDRLVPTTVTGLSSGVAAVSVGNAHSCAVTTGGAAKCWGANTYGQLGTNSLNDSPVPVTVSGLSSGVVAIAAGFDHTCAVMSSGAATCWGANTYGQLGNGTTTASLTPVAVTGLASGVARVAVSSAQIAHSCALTTAGALRCWGANGDGELGDATDTFRTTPVTPEGLGSGVKAMDVGNSHTCAVTTSGGALCWGFGGQGQLGNDRTFDRYTPTEVTGLQSGVASISAGVDHTCAVMVNGSARCWGYGADGQLGTGSADGTIVPAVVANLTNLLSVSAGGFHTCGVLATGAGACWGGNGYGQLGTDSTDGSLVAVTPNGLAGGAAPALLRVTTSPAVPSQILVDGTITDSWGLQWMKVLAGSHQVCFTAVPGFTTPPCQIANAVTGATATVVGTFVARGYLQVSTSPAVGSRISVDGVPRDNWGVYTDLATGSHQVCFGPVAGFTPPPCQDVTVSAGATTSVTGTFTASSGVALGGVGTLRVTTSPALPSQITIDGEIADTWGLDWLEVAPGSHTICFRHVQGYTSPPCQTVTVSDGATTSVTGVFAPRGYLKVQTSPAVAATITVDGVPADDWGVFTDLPPGTYHVCFGAVAGKTAPACQDPTVSAGTTTSVTGAYS